jgi:hypothetical protein
VWAIEVRQDETAGPREWTGALDTGGAVRIVTNEAAFAQ